MTKDITDPELLDRLKHEGAMWFSNPNLLLLEELFRRYNALKSQIQNHPREVRRTEGD